MLRSRPEHRVPERQASAAHALPSAAQDSVKKLTANNCELCESDGGEVLWCDRICRVVSIADSDYPGFCRVVLQDHVGEMTQLDPRTRDRLMQAVFATEEALRELMSPHKINLASFGNLVPHLHWHVIPRFASDRHFPAPVWAPPRREFASVAQAPDPSALAMRLQRALG
jgi:diadenosine tetraphosphate (Ap4A) HIT family hydrolase